MTVDELYDACRDAGIHARDRGQDVIWGQNDQRYKRRVRNALQSLKRAGRAQRVGDGTWLIEGCRERPRRIMLVVAIDGLGNVELDRLELVWSDAAGLLDDLADGEIEVDLVLADPPWALDRQVRGDPNRDRGERVYQRDGRHVVGGYVEVAAERYPEFTRRWVEAAASLLDRRRGAYLAAITGPQQAARVQCAAEDAGLTYVNQIVVRKPFALRTTRRFAHAHTVVTLLCSGKLESIRRHFAVPAELPRARSGATYPLDWWDDITKRGAERQGRLRYDNALAPELVSRVVRATTRGPEAGGTAWESLVVDPFCGSGTTAMVCARLARRCITGDANPEALRFAAARLAVEEAGTLAVARAA